MLKFNQTGFNQFIENWMNRKPDLHTVIIKLLLLAVFLLFVYSLIDRIPDIDDAWIGEPAYWQYKLGFAKSELMNGITFQNIRVLTHHKLLTLQGVFLIKLFGYSLVTFKLLSLFYLCGFFILFYAYTYKKLFSPLEFWFSILLFISNALIFQYSFVFRPEIPLMALGYISYMFLEKVLNNQRTNYSFVVISGLFAGLCVSTHLNGIIFPVAGLLLLLWNKKYLQSIVFGFSTLPTILIYFYDFTSKFNFSFWLYQLNKTPAYDRISESPILVQYLMRILNEQMRFFHGPIEISFSILFILVFAIAFKKLKQHRNLMRYLFLLVLFTALVSIHLTSKYMMPYIPYIIMLTILSVRNIFARNNEDKSVFQFIDYKKVKILVFILVILYLGVNNYYNFQLSKEKWNVKENSNIVQTYIKENTNNCSIVAPMTFIFNEITRFKSIQSELAYTEMQKSEKALVGKAFLIRTKFYNIDYIILSEEFIRKLKMDIISDAEIAACNFQVLSKSNTLMILKRCKPEILVQE